MDFYEEKNNFNLFNSLLKKLSKIFGGVDYKKYTIDDLSDVTVRQPENGEYFGQCTTSGISCTAGSAGGWTSGTNGGCTGGYGSGTSGTSGHPVIKKDIRDRFEYKCDKLEDPGDWDHNIDYLNTMGEDGWEIVFYYDISAFLTKIIWKRKIIIPPISSGTCGNS